jgi:hypothetical protein
MSAFDDREKAFEAKYHFDEELAFKVNARRDKLLGLWVAEKLGFAGVDADNYAKAVVEADFADAHHEKMVKMLLDDLASKNIDISSDKLHRQMDRLLLVAHQQMIGEVADGSQAISPE